MPQLIDLPVLEILQVGFFGFAFLLMFFAYRLLAQLIQRRENENPTTLKIRLTGVIAFLLLTVVVMGLGIYSTISSNNVTIAIDMTPKKLEKLETIVIKVGGKSYQRNDRMTGGTIADKAQIPNGQRLTIDLEDVSDFIDSLKATKIALETDITNLNKEKEGQLEQLDTLKRAIIALEVRGNPLLAETEGGI